MQFLKEINHKFQQIAESLDSGSDGQITKAALYIVTIVVALWCLNWSLVFLETDTRGTIGDMFGGLNALFSGLAFVGVIYAILLQREELKLQREDNKLTRKELEETRGEVKAQTEELLKSNEFRAHQNFETTFFQMLSVQQTIVGSMDLLEGSTRRTVAQGRDCFKIFVNDMNKTQQHHINNLPKKNIIFTYEQIYKQHRSDLGHYFRTLYNIIKLIEKSDVNKKRFYTNLVRAQMSDYEVAILFLNCLSPHGEDKFKPLVEKYSLLKMMDFELIPETGALKKRYEQSAFN